MKSSYLVDTHVHLDMSPLNSDIPSVIRNAEQAGVMQMITIGIDESSSKRAVDIAAVYRNVFAAVGIHPHDADGVSLADLDRLRVMAAAAGRGTVVAWGEVGLDYAKEYSSREVQHKVFAWQIGLACELGLPLVIHARDANDDALAILKSELADGCRGVFHCFSGDVSIAKQVLDMGFYISVTGIVTFKNAHVTREIVRYVPEDRLLLETDAPFLSPVPFRGKPNEPARTAVVAEKVAGIRGISIEEAACRTTRNVQDLFGLAPV